MAFVAAAVAAVLAHDALFKQPHLKCNACKVVAYELLERKKEVIELNANPVQVSHRLGQGKWDPHGQGGVKKMDYAHSQLMAIDTMEGLCDGSEIQRYRLKVDPSDPDLRHFSTNATLKDAEHYDKTDKDVVKSPAKHLKLACHELLELHDELVEKELRKDHDAAELARAICTDGSKLCKNEEAKAKVEKKAKAASEARKRAKVDKARAEGTARSVQIAEILFQYEGRTLNLSELNATARSDNGSHPHNEGPANVVDSDHSTKCLDHAKKPLVIEFPTEVTVDAFTFVTANDYPERDPVRWTLSGLVSTIVEKAPKEEKQQEPAAAEGSAEAKEEKKEEEDAKKEEEAKEEGDVVVVSKEEVQEEWVVLHSVPDTPHPVPHNRSHQLEWFNFTSAVSYKSYKFVPHAKPKRKKKAKKVKQPKKEEEGKPQAAPEDRKDEL